MSERWPGHAVLQVPVPELEEFVRSRTVHYDPGFVGRSDVGGEHYVHAHVTALASFPVIPDLAMVSSIARAQRAFDHVLREVAVFPNGIIHVAPEPDGCFRELTARCLATFPEVLPYGGRFPVSPHVTLDAVGPGVDLDQVRESTSRVLPCTSRADRLDLVWYQQGSTRLVARWALGG